MVVHIQFAIEEASWTGHADNVTYLAASVALLRCYRGTDNAPLHTVVPPFAPRRWGIPDDSHSHLVVLRMLTVHTTLHVRHIYVCLCVCMFVWLLLQLVAQRGSKHLSTRCAKRVKKREGEREWEGGRGGDSACSIIQSTLDFDSIRIQCVCIWGEADAEATSTAAAAAHTYSHTQTCVLCREMVTHTTAFGFLLICNAILCIGSSFTHSLTHSLSLSLSHTLIRSLSLSLSLTLSRLSPYRSFSVAMYSAPHAIHVCACECVCVCLCGGA